MSHSVWQVELPAHDGLLGAPDRILLQAMAETFDSNHYEYYDELCATHCDWPFGEGFSYDMLLDSCAHLIEILLELDDFPTSAWPLIFSEDDYAWILAIQDEDLSFFTHLQLRFMLRRLRRLFLEAFEWAYHQYCVDSFDTQLDN